MKCRDGLQFVPMLLDRFHNDPSPAVQEGAACGLAQSGRYTHEQRMMVASALVNWLDDSQLSPQQRGWTVQALRDISGQSYDGFSGMAKLVGQCSLANQAVI